MDWQTAREKRAKSGFGKRKAELIKELRLVEYSITHAIITNVIQGNPEAALALEESRNEKEKLELELEGICR